MKQQPDQPGELHDCPPHRRYVGVHVAYTETREMECSFFAVGPADATDEEILNKLRDGEWGEKGWYERVRSHSIGSPTERKVEHRQLLNIEIEKAKDNAPKDV